MDARYEANDALLRILYQHCTANVKIAEVEAGILPAGMYEEKEPGPKRKAKAKAPKDAEHTDASLPFTLPALRPEVAEASEPATDLNGQVDEIVSRFLIEDEEFRRLLEALDSEHAVEGDLKTDDHLAAVKIREEAMRQGMTSLAAEQLNTIRKALNVVLRRYGMSRKERGVRARLMRMRHKRPSRSRRRWHELGRSAGCRSRLVVHRPLASIERRWKGLRRPATRASRPGKTSTLSRWD